MAAAVQARRQEFIIKENDPSISKAKVAFDEVEFRAAMQGSLESARIEAAVAGTERAQFQYSVGGGVVGALFYFHLDVHLRGSRPERFHGSAGGIGTVGGGTFFGTLYTDDLDALCAKTVSFYYVGAPAYVYVSFSDGNGKELGRIHAGAVSIVSAAAKGSGGWTR